jgi:hypothetical protein
VVTCRRELLEVSFELTDRGGRARDVGGDGPDISSSVVVWLVLRTASFKAIEDFFR